MTKRHVRLAVFLTAGIVLMGAMIAGLLYHQHIAGPPLPPQYYAPHTVTSGVIPRFDHIVIIVEENKTLGSVLGDEDAPYINQLARTYSYATKYYAITHPSLPNYIALTSGTTAGITNDCNPPSTSCQAAVPNIADRLEAAKLSWKMYAEGMPAPCSAANAGNYAVKHNPFMYYPDISNNDTRCREHIVPFTQLQADLRSSTTLPPYAFISPDLCHDMHNCSVRTGDAWLAKEVPSILASPAFTKQHSLLVITWDEGVGQDNNVLTVFAGDSVKRSYISSAYYSHYSLLRTIEKSWNLPPLTTNDDAAPAINDIFTQPL